MQVSNRCERWLWAQAGETGKDRIIIDQDSFISLHNPLPASTLGTLQSNLLGSSRVVHQAPVHGIIQTRILQRVAISSFRGSSPPWDQTFISSVSCIGSRFFITGPPGKPTCMCKALLFLTSVAIDYTPIFKYTNTPQEFGYTILFFSILTPFWHPLLSMDSFNNFSLHNI